MPMLLIMVTALMFVYFTVSSFRVAHAREVERQFMKEQGMPPPSAWSMSYYPIMAILTGALLMTVFLPPWPYQPLAWALFGGMIALGHLPFLALIGLGIATYKANHDVLGGVVYMFAVWLLMTGYGLLVSGLGVVVLYVMYNIE